MNHTRFLVYPGPTFTHKFPCIVTRPNADERCGTLLGWATSREIAEKAAQDFLSTPRLILIGFWTED